MVLSHEPRTAYLIRLVTSGITRSCVFCTVLAPLNSTPPPFSAFPQPWPATCPGFCFEGRQATSIRHSKTGRLLDGQKIEAPRVDNSRCSHVEGTSKEENSGEKHRSDLETERRRNPAKGVQYRFVARHSRLIPSSAVHSATAF